MANTIGLIPTKSHGLGVVVADDGSAGQTDEVVRVAYPGRSSFPGEHAVTQGANPARRTGVAKAQGEWIVTIDSDWVLLPHALQRFYETAQSLPSDIGAMGARLQWDTARVTPTFVPKAAIDYEGRIRWIEAEGGSDHLFCWSTCSRSLPITLPLGKSY
jgi:glycosyltransferase involved in cell wall biosynthesis